MTQLLNRLARVVAIALILPYLFCLHLRDAIRRRAYRNRYTR